MCVLAAYRRACGSSRSAWSKGQQPPGEQQFLNCCSFPVSAHVSVLAASLLPLQLFGTPFLWPLVVVAPLTVFGANSKLSSITLLSGLFNAPPHQAPQIRRVSRSTNLLTYLLTYSALTA